MNNRTFTILLLALLVIGVLGWRWVNVRSELADHKLQDATSKFEQIAAENQRINKIQLEEIRHLRETQDKLHAANQALSVRMEQRDQARREAQQQLQDRQQAIAKLPLPQLSARWIELANLQPSDVQPQENSVQVTPLGARETVTLLEEVPVLRNSVESLSQDKVDLSQKVLNKDKEIFGLEREIILDKDRADRTATEHTAEVNVLNTRNEKTVADARKSKKRWFTVGIVVGVVLSALAGR